MSMNKDKGLIGSTSDHLKETTGILRGMKQWHSANSDVYHNNVNCRTGNSIKPEKLGQGTDGKPLCDECERLNTAGGPVGNLTNLYQSGTPASQASQHAAGLRPCLSGFRFVSQVRQFTNRYTSRHGKVFLRVFP